MQIALYEFHTGQKLDNLRTVKSLTEALVVASKFFSFLGGASIYFENIGHLPNAQEESLTFISPSKNICVVIENYNIPELEGTSPLFKIENGMTWLPLHLSCGRSMRRKPPMTNIEEINSAKTFSD